MAIDFSGDIFPLYASDVVTDAEYLAVDASRRNEAAEQNLLTMIEVVRAYMATLRSENAANIAHYVLSRQLADFSISSGSYDNVTVNVQGNDVGVVITSADGDTVSVTDGNGTDAVVLDDAPYADTAAIVADINSQLVTATDVESYVVIGGKIGFRNTTGNEGNSFTLAVGAGPSVLTKAGISPGVYLNEVEEIANSARDDGLAYYEKSGNPTTL